MSCTHPIRAFPTGLKTEKGKDDYFLSFSFDETIPNSSLVKSGRPPVGPLREFIEVPCGKCYECRKEKARKWAFRCLFEASEHKSNYFLTVTYEDGFLPRDDQEQKRDLQLFFKRLRRAGKEFRYFACGEKGDATERRHNHCLMFGLELGDLKPWAMSGKFQLYRSEFLERLWDRKGFIWVGVASPGSVGNYIAKYTIKNDGLGGFLLMSRKPGLGFDAMLRFMEEESPVPAQWRLLTIGDGSGRSVNGSLPRTLRERLELSPSDELTRATIITLQNKMRANGFTDWQTRTYAYIEKFRESAEFEDKKKEVARNLSNM